MAKEPGCTYTFGDSARAADRLALLAGIFDPTTAAFIRDAGLSRPPLALDLGCATGWTTNTLAAVAKAHRTVGLDLSAAFLERARSLWIRSEPGPTVEFLEHDVTRVPFPTGRADLIFARYLLAHLPDLAELIASWTTQLKPGGRLLLEEVEAISTSVPTFALYLEHAAAMLRRHRTELYLGAALDAMAAPAGTLRVESRTAETSPPTAKAAAMFAMNLATWQADEFIRATVPQDELRALAAELNSLSSSPQASRTTGEIVWTHRQLAFEQT